MIQEVCKLAGSDLAMAILQLLHCRRHASNLQDRGHGGRHSTAYEHSCDGAVGAKNPADRSRTAEAWCQSGVRPHRVRDRDAGGKARMSASVPRVATTLRCEE